MQIGLWVQATGLFAVTNIDDLVILALFFGQTVDHRGVVRVIAGQYLGFGAIIVASIGGALGAGLLPETAIPYLGVLPLALGLRAAWATWREHRDGDDDEPSGQPATGPGVLAVAAVTLANGGDNIGVYVPVFATAGPGGIVTYVAVFLVLVAVLCAAGYYVARHPLITRALSRWGHILLPIVLIGIGLVIMIEGHAFGL